MMSAVNRKPSNIVAVDFTMIDKAYKASIMLDTKAFRSKPKSKDIGSIKRRMGALTPFAGTVEKIATKQAQGYSITPAVLKGGCRNENWQSQQLFGVDIDNYDGKILKMEQFLNRCESIGIFPAYTIATFSDTEELPKYRAYFLCDTVIKDRNLCKQVYAAFSEVFPEADKLEDFSRLFFGGKKLLYQNYESRFFVDALLNNSNPEPRSATETKPEDSELRKLAFDYPFLEHIRGMGTCKETKFSDRIGFNPCPLCGHNDDFFYYHETNT